MLHFTTYRYLVGARLDKIGESTEQDKLDHRGDEDNSDDSKFFCDMDITDDEIEMDKTSSYDSRKQTDQVC